MRFFFALVMLTFVQMPAHAADSSTNYSDESENQSTLNAEDITPDKNKAPGDVDDVITNNLLRAESGSKSRYSVATSFAYDGGSVNEPLGQFRPNITAGNAVTAASFLVGDISGKYNFDQTHSLFAGIGVRWITPLYGTSTPKGYSGTKFDADNPYLTYQYVYKFKGIQNILTVGPTLYTNANDMYQGYVANGAIGQTSAYEIKNTGLTFGVSLSAGATTFNKNGGIDKYTGQPILSEQSDYMFAAYPYLEYQLSPKLNLRTLVGFQAEHTRNISSASTFMADKVYQSLGVGISVTRDIFLYPNIQFIPDELRPSNTNVAISSYINIF